MTQDNAPEEKVPLSGLSTFKAGGDARYLFRVGSILELQEALAFAKEKSLPLFILGGGSNMLFKEEGFEGVVIKIEIKGIEVKEEGDMAFVRAGAGEVWDPFVHRTIEQGYFGLENLSAIPGLVGAAPVQNIGAYGVEAKDLIFEVEVFDRDTFQTKTLSNAQCAFGYRDSIFKHPEGEGLIVLSVTFKLSKTPLPKLSYKDLSNYFEAKTDPTPLEVRNAVTLIRSKKFPDLTTHGTAGSFFKNVICEASLAEDLKAKYPDLPVYDMPHGEKKLSTAFIMDKICGLKNFREGNVGLYENQTLVVVNYGGATATEINNFIVKVKGIVKEKTGIELEEEVVVM